MLHPFVHHLLHFIYSYFPTLCMTTMLFFARLLSNSSKTVDLNGRTHTAPNPIYAREHGCTADYNSSQCNEQNIEQSS